MRRRLALSVLSWTFVACADPVEPVDAGTVAQDSSPPVVDVARDVGSTTDSAAIDIVSILDAGFDATDAHDTTPDSHDAGCVACRQLGEVCEDDSECGDTLFCARIGPEFGHALGTRACVSLNAPEFGAVVTIAGTGRIGSADGTALEATFFGPRAVVRDAQGTVFVADFSNHQTRRVADGEVSTMDVGGSGVAIDYDDALFVASEVDHVIYRIDRDGSTSVWAGTMGESGLVDGMGTDAVFDHPTGLAVHPDGGLVVADKYAHAIRRVTNDRMVTTVAGRGQAGFQDGSASEALFNYPEGLAVDSDGRIYVADKYNHRVRLISDGVVSTVIGNGELGYVDGPSSESRIAHPLDVTIDVWGTVFVADWGNSAIRSLETDGVVRTVAGGITRGFLDGTPEEARLAGVSGVFAAPNGWVYFGDRGNHRVRALVRDVNP